MRIKIILTGCDKLRTLICNYPIQLEGRPAQLQICQLGPVNDEDEYRYAEDILPGFFSSGLFLKFFNNKFLRISASIIASYLLLKFLYSILHQPSFDIGFGSSAGHAGAAGGMAGGTAGGVAGGTAGGIAGGTAGGIAGGTAGGVAGGTAGGVAGGTAGSGMAGGAAGAAAGHAGGGISGLILAHPIMLGIAGSIVLCALAYLLYRKIRMQTTAPAATPSTSTTDNKLILTEEKKTPSTPKHSFVTDNKKDYYQKYYDTFEKTVSRGKLNSLDQIIPNKHKFAPLLLLKANQDPLAVDAIIVRYLNQQEVDTLKNHLFINDPKDFEYYLSPGKLAEDGTRSREPNGPLRKLLQSQSPIIVLVINWRNFSSTQKAACQSLLDQTPTLTIGDEAGLTVQKQVVAIGVLSETDPLDKAFLSRSKCWEVQDAFFTSVPAPTPSETKGEEKAELFNTSAYEELVFGPLILDGKKMEHIEGPLLKAIKNKCPLVIYNPPNTERFKLFMHQVNEQKKLLLLEGKWYLFHQRSKSSRWHRIFPMTTLL